MESGQTVNAVVELPCFNGMSLPPFPRFLDDPINALHQIRDFPSRQTDILVCGQIRSGNHWLFEIVSKIVSGRLELSKDTVIKSQLEHNDVETLEKKADPRIITSHLPYRYLPMKHKENKGKIVLIVRNPKDREVSAYNFLIGKDPRLTDSYTWDEHFNGMAIGRRRGFPAPYGDWFRYVRDWEVQTRKNQNIHVVHYENLQKNFVDEVSKLAKFLQCERDDQFYRDAEGVCSIDNMKQNKEDDTKQFDVNGMSTAYRTGKIGTWKKYFTKKQNDYFERLYQLEMSESDLEFVYE